MQNIGWSVSVPGMEYAQNGVVVHGAADFTIVQSIWESSGCSEVSQLWFSVGDQFGYNALTREGPYVVGADVDEPTLPNLSEDTGDEEFVVLLTTAGAMRKMANALKARTSP